jgi:hypothetical protein
MTDHKECSESGHDIAEWGIVSLVVGASLFLTAPMTLQLSVLVWAFSDHAPVTVLLHAWLARIGIVIVLLTAVSGVVFAAKAIRLRWRYRQPLGFAIAGLVLNLAASGLWVITSIALLNTTESLLRLYGPVYGGK